MAGEVNLLENFGEGATTEQVFEGIGASVDALASGAGSAIQIGQNLKTAKDIDERGNTLGKKDYVGNTMAGMKAGADIGGLFGPIGAGIGGLVGGGAGAVATALTGGPDSHDASVAKKQFELGIGMKAIRPEATLTKQQLMAEDGMDVKGGDKEIEVERDEIVLRKYGKVFKKVADFKGGKTHENGGEQYTAEEGDIIFPGKDRNKITQLMKTRRWSAIESARQKLPTDMGQKEFAKGTKGTKDPAYTKTGLDAQNYIYHRLVDAGMKPNAAKGLIVNLTHESANFTAQEEFEENVNNVKGLGIAQWSDGPDANRREAFEKFLKKEGKDVKDIEANVDFLISELKGEQGYNVGSSISSFNKNADSVELAAMHGLTNFERPKDQSAAMNARRIKESNAFLKQKEIPKVEIVETPVNNKTAGSDMPLPEGSDNTAGPVELKNIPVEDRNKVIAQAKINEEKQATDPKTRGYFHTEDPESIVKNIDVSITGNPLNDWLGNKLNLAKRLTGESVDQVGFTDPKLKNSMDNFMSMLQKGGTVNHLKGKKGVSGQDLSNVKGLDKTWMVGDVFRTWSAALSKGITGESFDAAIPNALAEITDGMSEKEFNEAIAYAKNNGILDEQGEYMARDIYNNPSKFWTSDMTTSVVADMSTILANPKALLTTGKQALNLIPNLIKLAKTPDKWKKLVTLTKKLPGGGKQVLKNMQSALKTDYRYKEGENLDDLVNLGTKLDDLEKERSLVTKVPPKTNWKETFTELRTAVMKLPNSTRKALVGKSYDEIAEINKQIKAITGKTSSELNSMSKAEVGQLFKGKLDEASNAVSAALKEQESAWNSLKGAKSNIAGYEKELEALKSRGASAEEIATMENNIVKGNEAFDAEFEVLRGTYERDALINKRWDRIGELEKFADSDLYKDKWRTLVDIQKGIDRHVEEIAKAGNIEGELANLVERQKAFSLGLGTMVNKLEKVKDANSKVVSVSKMIENAKNSVAALEGGTKRAESAVKGTTDAFTNLKNTLKDAPELLRAIEKDADLVKQLKKGTVDAARVINALTKAGAKPHEIENIKSAISKEEIDGIPGSVAVKDRPRVSLPDTKIGLDKTELEKGNPSMEDQTLIETGPPKGVEIQAGGEKDKIGAKIMEGVTAGLDSLAAYAPAIYNISQGLQPADKAPRRYVQPQLKEYENMSQGHINAIDDAFAAAVGNARNLSGGQMSNFRSNTEKAWADKIKRRGEVNTMETGRADAIAKGNIDSLNRADEVNAQMGAKADQMDMQSEASKRSFLAQGMQDIAAIGGQRRADRSAAKNQEMLLEMMGTANFSLDPNTMKIGLNSQKKTAPAAVTATAPQAGKNIWDIIGRPSESKNPLESVEDVNPFTNFTPSQDEVLITGKNKNI